MNAPLVVLLLTVLRLVIPFGLILLIGELIRRRDANYWLNFVRLRWIPLSLCSLSSRGLRSG